MDLNETYSWLNRSRKYDSEIRRLKAKSEELKSCLLSSGIDYSKERVNSSPDDAMSKIFAEIDETEQMIREKSLERGCVISEISDTIETLDSELEKTIKVRLLGNELVIPVMHEQYFYKDYLAYQPDYVEKILLASKLAHEAGRDFIFIEETSR